MSYAPDTLDDLQTSEIRYRRLFESARDGILILDAVTRKITDVNLFMVELLGYTREEFLGKELWEIGLLKDEEESITAFKELQEKNYIRYDDMPLKTNDGERREVEFVSNVYTENGHQVIQCNIRDISKRVRTQESLRLSEASLANAQRIAHLGNWDWDIQNNQLYWSDEIYRIFGLAKTQFEGTYEDFMKAIHPEDRQSVQTAVDAALSRIAPYNIEHRVIHPNGDERIVGCIGEVTFDVSGKPLQFTGTVQDITERKQQELSLVKLASQIEQQARISNTTLSSITDFAFIFDRDCRFVYANKPLLELWGLTLDEVVGNNFFDLRYPDDLAARLQQQIQQVFDTQQELRGETPYTSPTGKSGYYEYIFNPVFADDGTVELVAGSTRDITERKISQEALRLSEERFRSLCESAPLGIFLADNQGQCLFSNHYLQTTAGLSSDEFLGFGWTAIIHPEDRKRIAKEWLTAAANGTESYQQYRFLPADGIVRWVNMRSAPIYSADRQVVSHVGTVEDITERKKAEDSIRFQAHLLDTVEQAIIASDLDGVVIYWNQFAQRLYGWSAVEAVGRNIVELTTPEINQEQAAKIMAQLRAGQSWSGEFMVQNKNGATFPAHVTNLPVNDKGTLIGIVGVSIDITEGKLTEEALRQAEANYRNLVESSPAIVYLAEPFPPFSPIYVSPNVTSFGYTAEEWFEKPDMWLSLIHEEDREYVLSTTEAAMYDGLDTDLKYRIITRDGAIHWLHDKGRFVSDDQGKRIGWQGVMLDITETKGLEEQLRRSQKLESVGRLAGGIAHDFNNMLTAINGYSELTLRKLESDNPLRHNIEEIKKAGERSALLTHQLLAFSRQQILQPVLLDLNEVITDTVKMLGRMIDEDIQLVIALKPKTGLVNVDPGQLSQIIVNLAVNARDAMPQGGRLTIETADVILEPDDAGQEVGIPPGAYVMLAVCDTGHGMDDKIRQQIFEPFFTTKEVGKGTGLGLSTVYGIVKQSGGNIEVDSKVGVGTTFRIYLPRVVEQSEVAEIKDTFDELPTGTETVLLAEDEELVRNLSRQILETCGYTVIEVRNGVEALKICENGDCKIDLLMTDIVMPQMGGRELAEKLTEKLPNIKILFTSGHTHNARVRHGVIETSTNFIQKPFSFDALARKVRELLDAAKS